MSKILDLLFADENRAALDEVSGHFDLGDKQTSREVAHRAAERSGVSSALLKKMLPVLAPLVLGALSKRVLGGSAAPPTRAGTGGLLASLLDGDDDGSIRDDSLGMAARGLAR